MARGRGERRKRGVCELQEAWWLRLGLELQRLEAEPQAGVALGFPSDPVSHLPSGLAVGRGLSGGQLFMDLRPRGTLKQRNAVFQLRFGKLFWPPGETDGSWVG